MKLGTDMVDIFVGHEKEQFRLHKDLLCLKVPYFDKMFNSGFKKGIDQTATLPEDDPRPFNLFVEWLYGDRFVTSRSREVVDRIQLYGFAEKICFQQLMDYTITDIISGLNKHNLALASRHTLLAYQVTCEGSPLRSFAYKSLVYSIAAWVDNGIWTTDVIAKAMLQSPDMTFDTIHALRSTNNGVARVDPKTLLLCEFHTHDAGQKCDFA